LAKSEFSNSRSDKQLFETPVLIVGAGPAGQMAALMLSYQGIASTIVERRIERSSAPKAHAVNGRTLEICATHGVDIDRIYELATPAEQGGFVQFMSTLSGVAFGHLPYERQDDAVREFTPYPLANISQPNFERELSNAVDQRPDISVLHGFTCTAIQQDETGVTASIDGNGSSAPLQVRCRYLLAADGASSRLRGMLDISMEGPEALQHFMAIHFHADLSTCVKNNPGILYFLMDPEVSATMIAFDHSDNWVLMHSCTEEEQDTALFDAARCTTLIQRAIGMQVTDIRVRNVNPWTMSSQVAEHYRSGRVFLVGDAAHRFPPTGGLGLNTGIGDVQNITWKIAAVERGWAGESLLDTYQTERKPVAEVNSAQSLNNAMKMFELFAYLYGNDPENAAERFNQAKREGSGSIALQQAIEAQRPHFDSLRLQLGYSYDEVDQRNELSEAVNISEYEPSFKVGKSLPHVWVNNNYQRVSLLQILPVDRFAMIAFSDHSEWQSALEQLNLPIYLLADGDSFMGVAAAWSDAPELADVSALLIRPDRHIAAVFAMTNESKLERLRGALTAVLFNSSLESAQEYV